MKNLEYASIFRLSIESILWKVRKILMLFSKIKYKAYKLIFQLFIDPDFDFLLCLLCNFDFSSHCLEILDGLKQILLFQVKILFADLHGLLDNLKSPWELIEKRTKYYQALITETLTAMNVDVSQLEFVKGTDYQLSA